MKRVGWIALAVALGAVAVFFWWRSGVEIAQPAHAGERVSVAPAIAASVDAAAAATPMKRESSQPEKQESPPPGSTDYAARFRDAPDLLEFARSLLAAGRAGDHAAQFYIFRALEYCADEQQLYFRLRGINKSLDEALKFAATIGWPFDPEVVRRSWNRCHTIFEAGANELGERRDWLRMSADGGYPLAQVFAARYLLRDLPRDRTNAVNDTDANREQRRSLIAKAIRSRDPEVIWQVANTPLGVLDADGEVDMEYMAWSVAACQRGFDCSPQSDAVRWACMWDRACQPFESLTDVLRRARGEEFTEIEARARWINEKIDAGDWEVLGF